MDEKETTAEDVCFSASRPQISETHRVWNEEMERRQLQVNALQAKLGEVKVSIKGSEEVATTELEVLWRRVKASATMLNNLKSKARTMAIPELAYTSCGIKQLVHAGFENINKSQLSKLSDDIDHSSFDITDGKTLVGISGQEGILDLEDETCVSEMLQSVQTVTDVMEFLVKRVTMAESEAAVQKEKVTLGQEEIKNKLVQIESLSMKLGEMAQFVQETNSGLNETRQRVEDLVEETTRQRQRAEENEDELCRVKRDFDSLKSYVATLTDVRETLLSSERLFQTKEELFERLSAKTAKLEDEKARKEVEVQKLMDENVRLAALLHKKDAQLVAMNEQCKVMALNVSQI